MTEYFFLIHCLVFLVLQIQEYFLDLYQGLVAVEADAYGLCLDVLHAELHDQLHVGNPLSAL